MPLLRNSKHELFAQELASGKSAAAAYKAVYGKDNRAGASRLQHNANISRRVAELLATREAIQAQATARAIQESAVSKEWVAAQARKVFERAMTVEPVLDAEGKPTGSFKFSGAVATRALELLARLFGYLATEKLKIEDVRPPLPDFSMLSREEKDALWRINEKMIAARSAATANGSG